MAERAPVNTKTERATPAAVLSAPQVLAAYARWAPIYDAAFGLQSLPGRRAAARIVNALPGGRVLEAGVGTGLSLPLYSPAHRITGIDLSPEMLTRSRERTKVEQLGNVDDLRLMDATALEFESASFDAVVAAYLVSVIPEPERALAEFSRVTRPGGRVIVVNHFGAETGWRAAIERSLAGWAVRHGWSPSLPESRVLGRPELKLLVRRPVQPLGLFTMLVFERL